jgi:hypothetical protein
VWQQLAVYSWYIEGPAKKIIVDTGSRMQMYSFPNWKNIGTPEERLKDFGLKPSDIDIVIVTHLHYEHIGHPKLYSNAKFYIQKKEYEYALDPHPAHSIFYDKRLIENLDVELIEGDTKIVDGVKVMLTPGHSPGSQSVLIETSKGIAGITGFCCVARNFEPPVRLQTKDNIINCGMHYDPIACYDNMIKLRDACDILIPVHEPEFVEVDRIPKPDIVYTSYDKIR